MSTLELLQDTERSYLGANGWDHQGLYWVAPYNSDRFQKGALVAQEIAIQAQKEKDSSGVWDRRSNENSEPPSLSSSEVLAGYRNFRNGLF